MSKLSRKTSSLQAAEINHKNYYFLLVRGLQLRGRGPGKRGMELRSEENLMLLHLPADGWPEDSGKHADVHLPPYCRQKDKRPIQAVFWLKWGESSVQFLDCERTPTEFRR